MGGIGEIGGCGETGAIFGAPAMGCGVGIFGVAGGGCEEGGGVAGVLGVEEVFMTLS
jgi:hypothetical protein